MAVPLPAAAGVEGTRESRDLSLPPWSGKTIDRSVTKLSDGQKKVSERKVPEPPEAGRENKIIKGDKGRNIGIT